MHIGIDGRFLQGKNTGVTNYLFNLLKGIKRLDTQNTYSIFLSNPDYNSRIPDSSNFYPRSNSINALIWKNLWFPKEVNRLKIDLVHFPAYTGSFVNIGDNVVTIPDVIHKVSPNWFSCKELVLLGLPIKLAIRKAKRIIAISENTKRDIIKYYRVPEEKIRVTLLAADDSFCPVNNSALLEAVKIKYAIDGDFIFNVGVLFKRRNIPRLLEAFSILKKDKTFQHKLVIAGPEKEGFNLAEHIEKYSINDDVIYLGYIEQSDMPLLYNAASFFIYPSLYEGFGLPVLEAMSCGKAVITSNVSSLPEVLGNTGILVDPYKTEDLCQAMDKLARDDVLRDQFGRAALERSKIFNWDNLASETIAVYKEVISE